MGNQRSRNRHIPALDGLRGLAIVAVIMCHVNHAFGGPFASDPVDRPLAAVFGCGWVGVDLFFVLSGFLITGILYDSKRSDGYFRNFYSRRALRIMPLYFGFLFLGLVALPRLWDWFESRYPISGADALSLDLFYYNFRVAFTEKPLRIFHPFWSLAVEEHFYLVWPMVVWALRRRSLMRMCLGAAAASLLLRVILVSTEVWPGAVFSVTPCRLDGLLAGSFLALAWRDQGAWAQVRKYAKRLLVGSGGLLLGLAAGQRHFIPDVDLRQEPLAAVSSSLVLTIGIAALAVFFSSLIVLALDAPLSSGLRRFLENKELGAIGKYSYAMYIFHSLILAGMARLFALLGEAPDLVLKPLATLSVLAVSFVAAWLSYHLYEKHFLRLKRYFEYREPVHSARQDLSRFPSYNNA